MSGLIDNLRRYIFEHELKAVSIEDNDYLTITFNKLNPFLSKRYLVFEDKKTGRRLQTVVNNKNVRVNLNDLYDVNDEGEFNLYLSYNVYKKKLRKRLKYNSKVKLPNYLNKENKSKINLFKTVKNNLYLKLEKIEYNHIVKEITSTDNAITLGGSIEVFNESVIKNAEILLQRRDNKEEYVFNCNVNKHATENLFEYTVFITPEQLRNDLVINSRWDFYLQLKDETDTVVHKVLINIHDFRDFTREEDRYVLNVNDGEKNLLALYATMGKNSLALWYTDSDQFARTYNIAKGKSIFNETAEQEQLNDRMIFFESFLGKNYSGNPKYIYEEMLRNESFKDFTFVWSYSGSETSHIPGNPIIVNRESGDYYKYMALSKYWVSNIIFPVHRKRNDNIYIQTWHGTPLKRLGFDIEINGPEVLARENFYTESRNWDYLISANRYSSDIFKRAFKFDKEVLEVGYPLNDIFYRSDLETVKQEIKKKINLPQDKKIILYAPTWRDNEMVGSWNHSFELKFDLQDFYQELKDDYIILLKMHHLVGDSLVIDDKYQSFVYDLSKYDDIQELYVIADLLITDYSSVFFDYANSKNPILFFAYDFEVYKNEVRGFYLDMDTDLPGPVIKNSRDLLDTIKDIDTVSSNYQAKYKEFYENFCYLEDGNASKRVLQRVFGK
jgi:CDP-glycerol glycerophosphotransferase (TagB/SpsB family)